MFYFFGKNEAVAPVTEDLTSVTDVCEALMFLCVFLQSKIPCFSTFSFLLGFSLQREQTEYYMKRERDKKEML